MTMDESLVKYIHTPTYSRVKKCSLKNSQTLNFGGNFTPCHRHFDITISDQRNSLRQNILNSVMKRTQSIMLEHQDSLNNPLYEDPKDVVVQKPPKPPRKRNIQGIAVTSPRKESTSLREQKKKLTKKYEGLISALMDRCEESVVVISHKESQITKLREKLKTVLEYNNLFANENDKLKSEHATLVTYIEGCKEVIRDEKEKNIHLEKRIKSLDDKVKNYEVPDKVQKPPKPPRKRNIQGIAVTSPRKESTSLREQKKKLTKKYEGLISALMDRCEESVVVISHKESQITKLREKLKTVLEYNNLFANENDKLKSEHATLVTYIEGCKEVIRDEKEKNIHLEKRIKSLDDKVKNYEVPDKEPSTIPLVEVCMSCSSRQIVLNQARDQNSRLQRDMQAMKDVLYRLNVQLSRYQEKLGSVQSFDNKNVFKPSDKCNLDSLLTASLCQQQDIEDSKNGYEEHTERVVDLSGLLSAQALAPLFDAYQENLQEKENLILDYEKQFENINKKSKVIVDENKVLSDKVNALDQELVRVKQCYKKLIVEKDTGDIERDTVLERAEKAELKLKEVYELYEDRMAGLMRDYETVHREYYTLRSALEASRAAAHRSRTVPADMHERRLADCTRLLEELKHQYAMESERKNDHIKKLEEDFRKIDEKYHKICEENEAMKEELRAALKNVRLYRKAAVVFRHRARSAAARASRARRKHRQTNSEPLKRALEALEKIKLEIKAVKSRAHSSLSELERRIVQQEAQSRRELERAALVLQHKEGVIRNLVDKVADVEEVRLSQTNAHRLQGIISDLSDPSISPKTQDKKEKEAKTDTKLVPGPGGYYREKDRKK